jgi:hypothetical protein
VWQYCAQLEYFASSIFLYCAKTCVEVGTHVTNYTGLNSGVNSKWRLMQYDANISVCPKNVVIRLVCPCSTMKQFTLTALKASNIK